MLRITKSALLMLLAAPAAGWSAGFYAGIGMGPDTADFRQSATVSQFSGGHLGFDVKTTDQLSGMGAFGTLFVGYGLTNRGFGAPYLNNNIYLATELNANISSLKHEGSNIEYVHASFSDTQYKISSHYGVGLLPGYLFTPYTLFYTRLGYENGNFKIFTNDASLANTSQSLSGFRWGFGLQEMLFPQFALRLEYNEILYQGTSVSTLDKLSNTGKTTHITPRTNQVEFGLVYSFA